jgi:sugar phosphate isomerase/epimerase
MQIGIFAKTLPGTNAEAVLMNVRQAGYERSQFNLACAGLPSLPDVVAEKVLRRIRAASKASGVALVALSGTYNMIDPHEVRRAQGLRRLGVLIEAAAVLGIPLVKLCTGTRDPEDQWRHHPDNTTPAAWHDLTTEMAKGLALAERHGIDLGIELEQANVVTSAADARRLMTGMDHHACVSCPIRLISSSGRRWSAPGPWCGTLWSGSATGSPWLMPRIGRRTAVS